MARAVIKTEDANGTITDMGTVVATGRGVQPVGTVDPFVVQYIRAGLVIDPQTKQRVDPVTDPVRWVKYLPGNLNGSAVWAETVN